MKIDDATREMAGRYAQVFLGTDAGKMVLADLRAKFNVGRLCFIEDDKGRMDHTRAAVTDGERRVMLHIEGAINIGAPGKGLPQIQPTQT
jgi:hypothetical protein